MDPVAPLARATAAPTRARAGSTDEKIQIFKETYSFGRWKKYWCIRAPLRGAFFFLLVFVVVVFYTAFILFLGFGVFGVFGVF